MTRLVPLACALVLAGCSTAIPVDGGVPLLGAASCAASDRGACPDLSGRTLYNREGGEVRYFAPDGTVHALRGTRVQRAKWSVSANGRRLLLPGGVTGFGSVGIPIGAFLATARSIPGDPIGLASRDAVAAPLRAYDPRPFAAIAAELRGG